MNLMSAVHESPYQLDGTEDYGVRSVCLRAMERCPGDADAGLAATGGRSPEVPEGVSPWRDHLFRDVLRLRFVRAESLLELGRTHEAFAEFEELLRIDPFDGMGATDFYFLALVDAGDYDRAQRLLDRFSDDRTPTLLWNETLAAYARGEKDTADARREEAMAANPRVETRSRRAGVAVKAKCAVAHAARSKFPCRTRSWSRHRASSRAG